ERHPRHGRGEEHDTQCCEGLSDRRYPSGLAALCTSGERCAGGRRSSLQADGGSHDGLVWAFPLGVCDRRGKGGSSRLSSPCDTGGRAGNGSTDAKECDAGYLLLEWIKRAAEEERTE